MDFEVPLNKLKFGQEDGAGINARVTGRDDGIAELAANINARGQIENLVVKACEGDFYSVSNGNRRLKAFHFIYGETSSRPIRCTLRDVDENGAFEDSLTTAVTARQLHPVDQHEAFARLRDKGGKTNEEIAREYGLTEKQVRQALALGGLSPKIREAWRKDEIRAETAQAFTLAKDIKAQERVFSKLLKDDELDAYNVRSELGIKTNRELAELVTFVTPDIYRARGGQITEDLFGEYHSVSDEALVKALATELLDTHCAFLIEVGWSWAKPLDDLPAGAQHWAQRHVQEKDLVWLDGEKERRAEFDKKLRAMESDSSSWDHDENERLEAAIEAIDRDVRGRSFSDKAKKQLGCIVDIVDGALEITYGLTKPAEQLPVKSGSKASVDDDGDAPAGEAAPAPKEATTISNAMADRLETQLLHATKDALLADTVGAHPLMKMLAGIVAEQIRPEQKFHMPPAIINKLKALREELDPKLLNAAMEKRFDAKDYFGGAPKVIVLKAIKEAVNADEARKLASSTKAEIGKFALANVVKTGWVPKELRTPHYKGPGSEGFKKPAAAAPPSMSPAMRTALHKAKKASKKTTSKKTVAKKRKAA